MADEYSQLYSALGYNEPPGGAGGLESFGAGSAEPPPLMPDQIKQLQQMMAEDPEAVMKWYRSAWGDHITEEDVWHALSEAQFAYENPSAAAAGLEAFGMFRKPQLPEGFTFPGYDPDIIPVDPGNKKFEEKGDVLGWVLFAGPQFVQGKLTGLNPVPFRFHDQVPSNFNYGLDEVADDGTLDIALFADFGVGLYHSLYIAKQLRERAFPYAIHLGDVYYAGRRSEFRDNFEVPLNPLLSKTTLYTMNANHEMLAGDGPYFAYIDKRRALNNQFQEGSYFCLRNSQFNIIGIDTAYHEDGRFPEAKLLDWLRDMLKAGKEAGCVNILLSPNEPYTYGDSDLSDLHADLKSIIKDVDLWFWGNTHYCALFDQTDQLPFIGSCIGHGGFPYARMSQTAKKDSKTPVPVRFVETRGRFPADTNLRPDMGNNGYCVMSLQKDGGVKLTYIDWMSNTRCTANLTRENGTLKIDSVDSEA